MSNQLNRIKFNKEQQKAVDFHKGAAGVIASAGSGKTAVLLGRIDNLIKKHGVFEHNILAVSFTNATAKELKDKLTSMGHAHVNVGTFHAICGQILRKEGINISNMIQEWQIENCFKDIDPMVDVRDVMNFISFQKNHMRTANDDFVDKESYYDHAELRKFYKAYENLKKKLRAYDFDDYLLLCLDLVRKNKGKYTFEYILVDEHQDSNKVQNHLLEEWCQSGNIFTLSDFRQALYSFRGGDVEYSMYMDNYWKDAKTLNVHTNYRSPQNIVEKSNNFIRKYYKDYKHYTDAVADNKTDGSITTRSFSDRMQEAKYVVDEIEAQISMGVPLNEISVIYRVNAHGDYVENELKRRKIDYDIANNGSFFKRREIAGILSFLRLVMDTEDNSAFEGAFRMRTYPLMYFSNILLRNIQEYARDESVPMFEAIMSIKYPKVWQRKNAQIFRSGINRLQAMYDDGASVVTLINEIVKRYRIKTFIDDKYSSIDEREERLESIKVLKSFAEDMELEDFINYVYTNNNIGKKKAKDNSVKLMSVHRSKGLEFDNVFVVGVEDEKFPDIKSNIDEEARIFYVAVTRSKKNLWISEIGHENKFMKQYNE